MISRIFSRLDNAERKLRHSFGKDIVTPAGRRWARLHYHLFDHAFLRVLWTNFFEIAPGVYRSNQPTHARLARYKEMGIRTVVNLRGADNFAHYLFEKESCAALGLKLVDVKLWARHAVEARYILAVIDALRAAEKPVVFHCKSGADRAGFVAAVYLIVFEGVPVEEARKQLHWRYVHFKFLRTGIQDYILRIYQARLARGEIGFEDWLRTEYDPQAAQAGFDSRTPPDALA